MHILARVGLLGAGAILMLPAAVQAQSATAPAEDLPAGGLEDIVVTARRTQEQLQTTPIAVTAFTSAAIAQRQITNVSALQQSTPGLVVTTNHSGIGISLRGQVQASADSSVDQSVGLYVDGIYVARQMGGRFDLIDIERVEVLHGPQGTLFGRNTTGGAVSIITNKPIDLLEGSVMAGVGNYDRRETTVILNLPFTNGLAARFAGRHMEHGGYGRNVFLNRDVGNDNYDTIRGTIRVDPSPNWSLLLSGEYVDRRSNGPLVTPTTIAAGVPVGIYGNLPFYDSAAEQKAYERIQMINTNATLTVDLGDATLKSMTGYRDLRVRSLSDFDTTPLPLFFSQASSDIKQFSQEGQALGKLSALDWIGGFFYFDEHGPERYSIFGGVLDYGSRIKHISYAPYAQATFHLSDTLRITGGLRYTWDKRKLQANNRLAGACFIDPALLDDVANCRANRSLSNSYFSYTAGVDYQASRAMFFYARTGMAHKSGGFNKTNNGLETFAPEKVTDYEIGVKSDLFSRRLRVNVAAFVAYYSNMQRPITSDQTGVPIALIQSVGKSRIAGAEIEVTALPIDGLELSGNAGLLDPKYTEFRDAGGDRSGEPFTRVSKLTWSLAATYSIPAHYGTFRLHADYGHQSRKFFFATPLTREPAYGLFNARASLELRQPDVEIALWARNLTKTKYLVENLDFLAAAMVNPGFPGEPRTYGASLTYRFGN